MLYFDRIEISEGTDVNKISAPKECNICPYWYFLNFSFKFQLNVCNRCHDLLMMSMNLSDIAILNIKDFDYGCIINRIYCIKNVHIWSYSGPHFSRIFPHSDWTRRDKEYLSVFSLNAENTGKMRTRITSNTDTFNTVNRKNEVIN